MIICAAIKIHTNTLPEPTIIPCWRHGCGYDLLKELVPNRDSYRVLAEGFINHKGEFLNREEAYKYAIDCGQITKYNQWYREDNELPNELYSEDLY